MKLLPEIEEVFEKINKNGYEANLVGGCVRDYLMERQINDIDMCTNAKPQDIMKIFNRIIPIGIEYGTVHVLIGDKEIEITTYRKDGVYKNARKPEEVKFISNLEEDLKRRDFTINAIAYNPKDGIIDKFGGQKDIEDKVIRCVGEPNERFSEDAIRMLRGIRFASRFKFDIEQNTLNAISKNKELINKVSKDRIRNELNGIFISNNLNIGMKYLIDTKLYNILFDKLYDTYEEQYKIIMKRIEGLRLIELSEEEVLKVVISVLFWKDNMEYSVESAYKFLKKYNYPNSITKDVLKIIKYINLIPENVQEVDDKMLRKQISNLDQIYPLYLKCIESIFYDDKKKVVEYIIKKIEKLDSNNLIYKKRDLAVNGNDLLDIGFPQGKAISLALDDLLNVVLENPNLNTKENLIGHIKRVGIESYIKNEPFYKLKKNASQRLKSEIVLNERLINEAKMLDEDIEKLNI